MTAWHMRWLGGVAMMFAGCIVSDDRCGENQVEYEGLFGGCVCAENTVPNSSGVGCRPCAATEEFKNGQCVPITIDAGIVESDSGATGPSAGTRGQDSPCTSQGECASFDATYCMLLAAPNVCMVQGCATKDRACASDRDCCSFSDLPLLAGTNGLCVPKGKCSAPGKLVTP